MALQRITGGKNICYRDLSPEDQPKKPIGADYWWETQYKGVTWKDLPYDERKEIYHCVLRDEVLDILEEQCDIHLREYHPVEYAQYLAKKLTDEEINRNIQENMSESEGEESLYL